MNKNNKTKKKDKNNNKKKKKEKKKKKKKDNQDRLISSGEGLCAPSHLTLHFFVGSGLSLSKAPPPKGHFPAVLEAFRLIFLPVPFLQIHHCHLFFFT